MLGAPTQMNRSIREQHDLAAQHAGVTLVVSGHDHEPLSRFAEDELEDAVGPWLVVEQTRRGLVQQQRAGVREQRARD